MDLLPETQRHKKILFFLNTLIIKLCVTVCVHMCKFLQMIF